MLDVVEAGLQAADPAPVVRELVVARAEGRRGGRRSRPPARDAEAGSWCWARARRASRIAAALEEVLGDAIAEGVVVAQALPPEELAPDRAADRRPPAADRRPAAVPRCACCGWRRPPGRTTSCSPASPAAARLSPRLPAGGVRFEEKRDLHQLLLGSGAPIRDINTVRKHVSRLQGRPPRGGRGGASIVNLTVSDVVDDPLDAITDPTVPDTTTTHDAIEVLHAYDLWDDVAPSIRRHLATPRAESPALDDDRHPEPDPGQRRGRGRGDGAPLRRPRDRRPRRSRPAWRARAGRSEPRWRRSPSRPTITAAPSRRRASCSERAARRP